MQRVNIFCSCEENRLRDSNLDYSNSMDEDSGEYDAVDLSDYLERYRKWRKKKKAKKGARSGKKKKKKKKKKKGKKKDGKKRGKKTWGGMDISHHGKGGIKGSGEFNKAKNGEKGTAEDNM